MGNAPGDLCGALSYDPILAQVMTGAHGLTWQNLGPLDPVFPDSWRLVVSPQYAAQAQSLCLVARIDQLAGGSPQNVLSSMFGPGIWIVQFVNALTGALESQPTGRVHFAVFRTGLAGATPASAPL